MKKIVASKRPVFYTGGVIISSGTSAELIKMAEALSIPVTNTLMGLGGFPGNHQLFLGMLGMHRTYAANMTITKSDLIIALGARFNDRPNGKIDKFAPSTRRSSMLTSIPHLSVSKNIKVDVPIVGDTRNFLHKMLEILIQDHESFKGYLKSIHEWLHTITEWKKNYPLTCQKNGGLKPQYVIESIYDLTKGKTIITTEVGQNQMRAAQFCKFLRPRTMLASGGLGTMNFWLPCRDKGPGSFSEIALHRYRRRRQHPDKLSRSLP